LDINNSDVDINLSRQKGLLFLSRQKGLLFSQKTYRPNRGLREEGYRKRAAVGMAIRCIQKCPISKNGVTILATI
jgi:hypothetical protein